MSYVPLQTLQEANISQKKQKQTAFWEQHVGVIWKTKLSNKEYPVTSAHLWMDSLVSVYFPCAAQFQHHTVTDGCTVKNNVFPSCAIKYFRSGSLDWSAELKGASAVVVAGWRMFGAQNFLSKNSSRQLCYYPTLIWQVYVKSRPNTVLYKNTPMCGRLTLHRHKLWVWCQKWPRRLRRRNSRWPLLKVTSHLSPHVRCLLLHN